MNENPNALKLNNNGIFYALFIIGILTIISGVIVFFYLSSDYRVSDYALYALVGGIVSGVVFLGFAEIVAQLENANNRLESIIINQNRLYMEVSKEILRRIEIDKNNELKDLITEYNNLIAQHKYDKTFEVLEKIKQKQSELTEIQSK